MYMQLTWDSDFFGIKIGRINDTNLNFKVLKEILKCAKKDNFKLIYWSSDNLLNSVEIESLNGCLVDTKTTLEVSCHGDVVEIPLGAHVIQQYDAKFAAEIEELSIQSGEFSRYAVDEHIPRDKFEMLYRIWIRKSIQGELAENVLIAVDNRCLAGLVTLGNENGKGSIGLLAVKKEFRGRKYGEALVKSAQKWFVDKKYSIGQVITQGGNIASINLYKKCGYSIIREEFFYHFWI